MAAKEKQEKEPSKEPPSNPPSPLVHDPDDKSGPLWMGVGLLLLGATVGLITGLSFAPGISQSLLTSVFTFAGGALLTYGGFVRVQSTSGTGLLLRTSRVGISLCCFSLGTIGGVEWGIQERLTRASALLNQSVTPPATNDSKPDPTKPPAEKPSPPINLMPLAGLQSDTASTCLEILSREDASYAGESGRSQALSDLAWVRHHLACTVRQTGSNP